MINTFKVVSFTSQIFIIIIKNLRRNNKKLKKQVKYLQKELIKQQTTEVTRHEC